MGKSVGLSQSVNPRDIFGEMTITVNNANGNLRQLQITDDLTGGMRLFFGGGQSRKRREYVRRNIPSGPR